MGENQEKHDHEEAKRNGVFDAFAQAVAGETPLPAGLSAADDGRENLRVLLAIYESGRTRQPVSLL